MNDLKSQAPKEMSAIDQEVENLNMQLGRIEKTISVCMDNFRRFDNPANKLNPEDFFRNQPSCPTENEANPNKLSDVYPYTKSGLVLKLNELSGYAKHLEERLTEFNEHHIVPTGYFFERNI